MEKNDNTGLGLIKAVIERVQNTSSLFARALKKLVNMSERDLRVFLGVKPVKIDMSELYIEPLDGQALIPDAKKMFVFIDANFKKWRLDSFGYCGTCETNMAICDVTEGGTFLQMVTSITPDLDKVIVSQNQVIRFCEKYPSLLNREGFGTFFLTRRGGKYYAINIRVGSEGLRAYVYDAESPVTSMDHLRVVLPQYALVGYR